MLQFILMRHAKSDRRAQAGDDFARPLNARGQRDAPRMGRGLLKRGLVPERIVSSPAERARQTAVAVAKELGIKERHIVWDDELYEASLKTLLRIVRRELQKCRNLMLIGHNPALEQLALHLSDAIQQYADAGKLLTTAAVAIFTLADTETEFKHNCAASALLIRPRDV